MEAGKKAKHQAAIAVQKEKGSKIREEKLRKQQEIVAAKLVRKKEAAKKKAVADAEDARRKAETEAEKKKVVAKAEADRERQKQEEKLRRERYKDVDIGLTTTFLRPLPPTPSPQCRGTWSTSRCSMLRAYGVPSALLCPNRGFRYAEEKRRKEGLAAEEKVRQEKQEVARSAQRATAFQREADRLELERAAAAVQAQSSPLPAGTPALNAADKVAGRRGAGYTATPPVAAVEEWPDLLGGGNSVVAPPVAAPEPPVLPKPKLSKKERKKAAAAERAAAAKATKAAKAAAASAAVAAAAVVPPSQKQALATLPSHESRHNFPHAFPSRAAPANLAMAPARLLRDAGPVSPIAPPGGGGTPTVFESTSPESFLGSAALGGESADTWDPTAADAGQPSADVLGGFDQLFSAWDAGEPAFPPDDATPWGSQPSPSGDQILPLGIAASAPLWAQQDPVVDTAGARALGGPSPGIPLLSSGSMDAFGGSSHLGTSSGSQPDAGLATSLPPSSATSGVWAPGGGHPGDQGASASTWGDPLPSQPTPADDISQQWSTPAQAQAEAARLAQSSWLSQQAEATGASRSVSTAAASSSWPGNQADAIGASRAVSAPWDPQGQDQQRWGGGGGGGGGSTLAVDAQAWSGGGSSVSGGGGGGIGSVALADPMANSPWGMQPDLGGANDGQLPWGDQQSPNHSPQSAGGQPWAAHGVAEPLHVEASWSSGPAAGFSGGGGGGGLGPSGFNPNAPNWNSQDDGSAFVDPNAGWQPAGVQLRDAMLGGPAGGHVTPGLGSGVGLGGPPGVGMSPTIGGGSPIVLTINGFQTMDTARSIKAFVAGKVPVRGYNEVPDIGCVLLELTNQGDAELVKGLLHNMDVQGAQLQVAYASPDVVESFKMLMQTQHVPPPDESPAAIFDTFVRTTGAPGIPRTPPFRPGLERWGRRAFPALCLFNDQIPNGNRNDYLPRGARP